MLKVYNTEEYKEYRGSESPGLPAVQEGEYHSELADRLRNARDKNIVRYKSIFVEGTRLVFVEAYYKTGSIQDQLGVGASKKIELVLASKFTFGLLKALDYLHSNGMVHGDIKTSKILIEPKSEYGILLADHQLCDVYNEVTNNEFEDSSLEERV